MELKAFWNKTGIYIFIITLVSVAPIIFLAFVEISNAKLYNSHSLQWLEMCFDQLKDDSSGINVCSNIRSQTNSAFNMGRSSLGPIVLFLSPIIGSLAAGIVALKQRIKTLEDVILKDSS